MNFKEIPQSWIIAGLAILLITLRAMGIDSWTTATLSIIIGYITGKHIEQTGTANKAESIKAVAELTAAALKEKCL